MKNKANRPPATLHMATNAADPSRPQDADQQDQPVNADSPQNQDSPRLAYATAKLLDRGVSPRAAARTTGYSRRLAAALKEQAKAESRAATIQVIVNYLSRDDLPDDGYQTTSQIAQALGAGPNDDIRSHLLSLRRSGTLLRNNDPHPDVPETPAQLAHEEPDPGPEDLIRSPEHWLGHQSILVQAALIRENLDEEDTSHIPVPLEAAAFILQTTARRILIEQEVMDSLSYRAAVASANDPQGPDDPTWPWPETILIESRQALQAFNDSGPSPVPIAVLVPADNRDTPSRGAVVVFCQDQTLTCDTTMLPDPPDPDDDPPLLHTRYLAALAAELVNQQKDNIHPQPLSRQDRRLLERKGLFNPWQTIQRAP